jgi:hypothetical protein
MVTLLSILGIIALAACSSSSNGADPSSSSSGSSAYQKAVDYAKCIRAHGVPNYPDPNSQGQFVLANGASNPVGQVSNSVINAAVQACQSLAPPSVAEGPSQNPGAGAGDTTAALKFAQCMRSHGEPNFPDPASNGSITLPQGMDPESTQFQNAQKACQSLMPQNPSGQGA